MPVSYHVQSRGFLAGCMRKHCPKEAHYANSCLNAYKTVSCDIIFPWQEQALSSTNFPVQSGDLRQNLMQCCERLSLSSSTL